MARAQDGTGSGQISVLLREARLAAGFTQRGLAGVAGISLGALRDIEQGRTSSPSWRAVENLAAALAVDHSRLAGLEPSYPATKPDRFRRIARPALRVCVLGPLAATRAGVSITLGPARQRAILGLLALHQPVGVSRDAIIDMLWGERAPSSVVTAVQGYISALRSLLCPDEPAEARGQVLVLAGASYRLSSDLQLDLIEFSRLSQRASEADRDGAPDRACRLYEQSLALWRGEVLADVEVLRDHAAVVEIRDRRDEAVRRFAGAALLDSRPDRALPRLRQLCAREPFDERAHALLMTVLAAAGQPAAALQLFEQLRRRLDLELGMRPSSEVTGAHLRVLHQS